jgi:hypothetical protein
MVTTPFGGLSTLIHLGIVVVKKIMQKIKTIRGITA